MCVWNSHKHKNSKNSEATLGTTDIFDKEERARKQGIRCQK